MVKKPKTQAGDQEERGSQGTHEGTHEETPEETHEDTQLADAVRASAHQIWQAGLGAFAKAQEEGGRVFSKLVKEGTEMQKRARAMAEDRVSGATDAVGEAADSAGRQAAGSWDKLEQVFEDRVARALGAIGVPNRKDIEALVRKIDQLSQAVAELSGKEAQAAKAPARKAAARPAPAAAPKPAARAVPKAAARAVPKAAAKAAAKPAAKPAAKNAAASPPATAVKKPAPKAPASRAGNGDE